MGHHEIPYTDAEAIAAAKTDSTLLNYTQGARVYNSAAITVGDASWTALTFDSERYDTDTIHSTVSNTSRLTCKTAGKYIIVAHLTFASNITGRRGITILLNGATTIARHLLDASQLGNHLINIPTIYDLSVDDYVELQAYQDSGGNLNVLSTNKFTPEFMMQRIG